MIQYIDNTPISFGTTTQARTRHRLFPVKRVCPPCPVIHCSTCCANDIGGAYLVGEDDDIHLQFYIEDMVNPDPTYPTMGWQTTSSGPDDYWLELHLFDESGAEIPLAGINEIADAWSVWHDGEQSIQNVTIPAQAIKDKGLKCFYFCVRVVSIEWSEFIVVDTVAQNQPTEPFEGQVYLDADNGAFIYIYTVLNNGDEGWVQQYQPPQGTLVYESSTGGWYNIVYDPINGSNKAVAMGRPDLVENPVGAESFCCTRLYKLVDCEDTVYVCSERGEGKDCLGRVYDRPRKGVIVGQTKAAFKLCRRYPGSVEADGYPIERTESADGVTISGKYSERARMRLAGICRYDAEELAMIIASEVFNIEGEGGWRVTGSVEKNNDEGSLWWPDLTVERDICEGTKECDFDFE